MSAPGWLVEFEDQFSTMLRVPLSRAGGRLFAQERNFPRALVESVLPRPGQTSAERLAVYNRQYWFRLLDLAQKAYPLLTRLLGHFSFNEPASLYFEQHPPTSRDLDRELERFPDFFEQWLNLTKSEDDRAYFRNALKLDHAIRQVFGSPASSPLVLDPALGAEVIALQLVMSDSCALYSELWPFLTERSAILAAPGGAPWPKLKELSAPNHALILRVASGIAVEFLRPEEARLYGLLSSKTVGEALALWEQEVASPDVAAMATAWLQKAMRLGLWKTYRRGA